MRRFSILASACTEVNAGQTEIRDVLLALRVLPIWPFKLLSWKGVLALSQLTIVASLSCKALSPVPGKIDPWEISS